MECLENQTLTDFGCIPNDPVGFVSIVYGIGLSLMGLLALLYLIYGGYLIMFSQGNKDSLIGGRRVIIYAVEALILSISGFLVYRLVLGDVLKLPGFS